MLNCIMHRGKIQHLSVWSKTVEHHHKLKPPKTAKQWNLVHTSTYMHKWQALYERAQLYNMYAFICRRRGRPELIHSVMETKISQLIIERGSGKVWAEIKFCTTPGAGWEHQVNRCSSLSHHMMAAGSLKEMEVPRGKSVIQLSHFSLQQGQISCWILYNSTKRKKKKKAG